MHAASHDPTGISEPNNVIDIEPNDVILKLFPDIFVTRFDCRVLSETRLFLVAGVASCESSIIN